MAILVVKASASTGAPPGVPNWGPGEIVFVAEDNHEFGTREVPGYGKFFHVRVTNRTRAQIEAYTEPWMHFPTTTVDQNDGAGNFRLTISSTMVSVSGKNGVTREMADQFIERWGGVYVNHTNSSYTFDINAYDAATSNGFWGDVAGVVFADEGFSSGTQQVRIDSSPYSPEQIQRRAESLGGSMVDADSILIPVAALKDEFQADIEQGWRNRIYKQKRWQITPAGMAIIAANGGEMKGTAKQIAPYLEDGLTT